MAMIIEVNSSDAMKQLGAQIGASVRGGETIMLIGDIGAGKTTFTKGLALAMGISEDVQSPTFTISRVYDTSDSRVLAHYDFYRLSDPGIMRAELTEAAHDSNTVTVIEWGDVVADALSKDVLSVKITLTGEDSRSVELTATGAAQRIIEEIQ